MDSGALKIRVSRFDDPAAFRARVAACLLENEAHNCVILGVLARFVESIARRQDEPALLMLAVEDGDGQVLGAATMTLPFPIVLSAIPAGIAGAVAEWVTQNGIALPGVTGE